MKLVACCLELGAAGSLARKNSYDGGIWYHSKFESVKDNKEYIKYKDKHEKHAEVKMISQIGELLKSKGFEGDNVIIQGGKAKKAN